MDEYYRLLRPNSGNGAAIVPQGKSKLM